LIERRRWRRQKLRRDCYLETQKGKRIAAQTVDISRNGVLVEVRGFRFKKFFRQGEQLTVDVPLAEVQGHGRPSIKFDAMVVRVEDGEGLTLIAVESFRAGVISSRRLPVQNVTMTTAKRLLM
jgi:hypothetical protein